MARWRLTAPHYIHVPGTEWEYRETNRDTGRQARKVFKVPALLNPDDPADCNYPGEIIVAQGTITGRDIEFEGDPTPDMEPLDDEARAISDRHRHKWIHPIETLSANGDFGAGLIEAFQKQIADIAAKPTNISAKGVDPKEFAKLQEQVAALVAQNASLQAKLAEKPQAARRT